VAIHRYLEVLSRRKLVLLAPLLLAVVGAMGVSLWTSPVYEASATVRIALAGRVAGEPVAPEHAERLTNTYVQILQSDPVLTKVITQLGLGTSPEQLLRRVDVATVPNTELMRITAEAGSSAEAQDLANALASALVIEGQRFYTGSASPSLADSFSVVESASLPESPVRPKWPLNMAIGLLVGLAAGVGLALALEYTDPTLRGVKDLDGITPLPVLSSIPRVKPPAMNGVVSPLRSKMGSNFSVSGEYRLLAVNLRSLLGEQQLRRILVTSAWPEEGTTSVAVSTAVALAQGGWEILLVDANLGNPLLHSVFKLSSYPGLRNVLATSHNGSHDVRQSLPAAVRESSISGLNVLTSGSGVGDPSWLLASAEMRKLVELLDKQKCVTIIDAPPILQSSDTAALAPLVDGVVVVCADGQTTTDSIQKAIDQLDSLGANLLGLVYNKARRR